MTLQRTFLRGMGIFFILVIITFILDVITFGLRIETIHKLLHVVLGVIMVALSFTASTQACKRFNIANGVLFGALAATGIIFPDLGGLDAFNRLDTALHGIVGLSSLGVGLWAR